MPEAKIGIAHGQMSEEGLESVMVEFMSGDTDVLACTTIIESGLDIPNANTLIVDDANRLGLAQLYQLRGRVGRGGNRAYAYFLYDKDRQLSATAEKRLGTIFEATELGAGFRIAMKDLEIRGAGNLLGKEQSGHIAAVGFDLYCQLLAEAVENLKKGAPPTPPHPPMPTVDLPLPAYIPEGYISDISARLGFYRRLAKIESPEEVREIAEELGDRFGKPPVPAENLLYMVRLKTLAMRAGVQSIFTKEGNVFVRLMDGMKQPEVEGAPGLKVGISQIQLNLKSLGRKWTKVLEDMLREIGEKITDSAPARSGCESAGSR